MPTLVDPTAKLGNYAVTSKNGTLTIIGLPVSVSITPNAGTGASAVFQSVYSDPSGANHISDARMMINTVVGWANSCGTRYLQSTNQLFLINDAGNGWFGPITPGATANLQNSHCILDAATSSAAISGNNLTINFSVTFAPSFSGRKNIYLLALDTVNSVNSPATLLGTWNPPVSKPAALSVTPNAGTSTSAVFQAVYSDASGATHITDARMMINTVVGWAQSCGTRYLQGTNQLFLINDAGTAWLGPITPGTTATVQNSHCVVNAATSSATVNGNNLTVNFSVNFLPLSGGKRNIYLLALDSVNNVNSAATLLGTWTAPVAVPAAVSVTPNAGTATSAVFQAVYSDASGATHITDARMMINTVVGWAQSCGTRYLQGTNQLFLINDAGTAWLGPITPGTTATVQNSHCVLNAATSSATVNGNNLTVNFSVNFLPLSGGKRNIYLLALDSVNNVNSAATLLGTWTTQ